MENKKHYTGLSNEQVLESRNKYGENILTPPERDPLWKLFLEKFEDPIIRILLIAAFLSLGISFVHMQFAETIGIFCAIFLATGVAFWFEMDANKKFDVLNQVNEDTLYKVIRNGNVCEIPKKEIVVGDIVILGTGEEVPADGELLDSYSLQIDESCLTGESIIDKTTNPANFHSDATYPSNWAMRGTKTMDGHGILEVRKVGDETEFGKVAEKATEMSGKETPLNEQLDKLAKVIGVVGLLLAAFTFITRFLKDMLLGEVVYDLTQLGLISGVIVSALIILTKVWLPIIYDALMLIGKEKELPSIIEGSTWFNWKKEEEYLNQELKKARGIKLKKIAKEEIQIVENRINQLNLKKSLLSWLQFLTIGISFFVLWVLIGLIFGNVNPLSRESWITLETAGHILQYFMISVTLIVVAVPEGLPMSVTLSLALSMRKMLRTNNLIRKMHACETMGATTVICTDKTGTLTQNQMQVHNTVFFGLNGNQVKNEELKEIIYEGISVNSTAHLDFSNPDKINSIGNPTEAALLLWMHKQQKNYLELREITPVLEQLTFSTERKYMATLVESQVLKKKVLYVKGAPEIVLDNCNNVLHCSELRDAKESENEINSLLSAYQDQAMRTLGFAYEIIEDTKDRFENGKLVNTNLTFLGVAAISDPVRTDVPEAVQKCFYAGIDVKMVTGDTPGTAKEIGRQIGIWQNNTYDNSLITGLGFEDRIIDLLVKYNIWLEEQKMEFLTKKYVEKDPKQRIESQDYEDLLLKIDFNDPLIKELVNIKILCRARPTDKQMLVQLLQKNGSVVAVTGDGTNDAPALNHAHVGLSMGSGTFVAKEASDITLVDDSFSSITNAVLWGRSIFRNIQRFIIFQLTINVAALIIDFIGAIFWGKLPLTVSQLLWVNLIMDTFAAGALASLPPDPKVMNDKPRDRKSFIVSKEMAKAIFGVGVLFVVLLLGLLYYFTTSDYFGTNQEGLCTKELTVFFTFFVMLQFWNMFNAKAFFTGKSAFIGLTNSIGFQIVALAIFIGQVLIVTFGGEVFRTVPLTFSEWLIIVGTTSLVLWIGELIRALKKR